MADATNSHQLTDDDHSDIEKRRSSSSLSSTIEDQTSIRDEAALTGDDNTLTDDGDVLTAADNVNMEPPPSYDDILSGRHPITRTNTATSTIAHQNNPDMSPGQTLSSRAVSVEEHQTSLDNTNQRDSTYRLSKRMMMTLVVMITLLTVVVFLIVFFSIRA